MNLPDMLITGEECLTFAKDWIEEPARTPDEIAELAGKIERRTGQKIDILRAAIALLLNEPGETLLLHRPVTDRSFPDTYGFPGGGYDETLDKTLGDTAKRETHEETGLEVVLVEAMGRSHSVHSKRRRIFAIDAYCVAQAPSSSREIILSVEHDNYRFITPADALALDGAADFKLPGSATRFWLKKLMETN